MIVENLFEEGPKRLESEDLMQVYENMNQDNNPKKKIKNEKK